METIFLITILMLIILIIIPLNMKVRFKYDFIKNEGSVTVRLLNLINIMNYHIEIHIKYLKAITKRKKQILIPIDFSRESIKHYADLNTLIFDKTTLHHAVLFMNFGIENEPFATAMLSTVMEIMSSVGFSFIKNSKSDLIVEKRIYTNFYKSQLKFAFKASASITIFDLAWCFAESKFIFAKKEVKNER